MPTFFQIAQLASAGAIPVSLWVVMGQIRDVKWTRLAPGIVLSVVFGAFVLTAQGVVPPLGTAFITTLLIGHTTTYLDDD